MGMSVLMRRHSGDPAALGRSIAALVQEGDKLGTEGYWSLPLKQFSSLINIDVSPSFFDALEHPMDRAFYDEITMRGKQERVTVPSFNISGWYDVFLQDTLDNFSQVRQHGGTPEARQSKLLVGPWSHGNFSNPVGEINFGFAASAALINLQSDLTSLQMRWFDHWLKGTDTGITSEAPIKLFIMGANIWRDEYEWPLARAVETRFYLHSNGKANSLNGDGRLSTEPPTTEEPDRYTYDPAHPVITRGGNLLMALEFPGGPFDQRPTEGRTDVLVYSTPPLEQDIEVTGRIRVHLWAISSAPDTDFVARLVDVHPDGYARNLADGIIRARYRHIENGEAPTLIEPGKAYEYEIDLWSTSNLFKAGHRIRLDVTSSNFPRWDRNPNTGHPLGNDAELVEARQIILHDQEHPSYVVLPVIPNP
jgi:putative CocE/NonD family hydrolase